VDPIKPTFKAPGSERLKLKCDDLLSNFAFKLNLRRYTAAEVTDFTFPSNTNGIVEVGGGVF